MIPLDAVEPTLSDGKLPPIDERLVILHPLYVLGYTISLVVASLLDASLPGSHTLAIVSAVVSLRCVGCVSFSLLPSPLRPAVTYFAGLLGVLAAKFTEASLAGQPLDSAARGPSAHHHHRSLAVHHEDGAHGGRRSSAASGVNSEYDARSARRRRTSSAALTSSGVLQPSGQGNQATAQTGGHKVRRTSLPALLANKGNHLLAQVSFSIGLHF